MLLAAINNMNGQPVLKKWFCKTALLSALLFSSLISGAQEIKATAKLDSSSIVIGQQVKLELSIQYRADKGKHIRVKFPQITDTIRKEVEVVSQSKVDTIISKNDPFLFTQVKTLYITSFDSGYWALPPFKFDVSTDTAGILTEPLLLQVGTVAVDTTQAIRGIKAPYEETYTWVDWLKDHMYIVYGSLVAILAIIIILIIIRRMRKVKPPMVIVEAPKIPAHIIALEKLEKLKQQKLWQEGKLKGYYSSLTDILREYIENRFKIQAMEQTTEEIIFGFRNAAVDEESKRKLKQVLMLADLVKFAKEQPLADENEASMNNVSDFINGTKREEEFSIDPKK
ncbi:MAG: hypothetical protein JWO44_1385 [Bacteroidetes bacterium]|nr:hypothetical protein [Bacteroidota bacterium]